MGKYGNRTRSGRRWRERELEETTEIGVHLGGGGEIETYYNGNSQESTRVTLAKSPNKGGYGT